MNKQLTKVILQAQSGNRIKILDIGARGGLQQPWKNLSPELISTVLVEPDPMEASRLAEVYKDKKGNVSEVIPMALWSSNRNLTLNINRSKGTSSVFEPNRKFLALFSDPERFETMGTLEIEAVSIDYLVNNKRLTSVDFAKIDVQGAELEILKGGLSFFKKNLIGLEVEVEFSRMYLKQPLFSNIDQYVQEELGLALWDLRGTYWKYKTTPYLGGGHKGQLVFGDVLYLRPIGGVIELCKELERSDAKHKVLSLLLSALAYGYYDYAYKVLEQKTLREIVGVKESKKIMDLISIKDESAKFSIKNSLSYFVHRVARRSNDLIRASRNNLGARKAGFLWWY